MPPETAKSSAPLTSTRLSGVRVLSARFGSLLAGKYKAPWVLLLTSALLFAAAGAALDSALTRDLEAQIEQKLRIIQDSKVATLLLWVESHTQVIEAFARSEVIRDGMRALKPGEGKPTDLPALAVVNTRLTQLMPLFDYEGWVLLDDQNHGVTNLEGFREITVPAEVLTKVGGSVSDKPQASPPITSGAALLKLNLADDSDSMWVWAPIQGKDGKRTGILGVRLDPAAEFRRLLHLGTHTGSIESYAFDSDGLMVSDSRFEPELRKLGLIKEGESSAMNIYLRDPGGNLAEGFEPTLPGPEQPRTRMARAAAQKRDGMDLDGYRDYRGVRVVGAWDWVDELNLGITTEMDHAEAFELLRPLRRGFWALFLVLVAAALAAFFYSSRAAALKRDMDAASVLGQYKLERKLGEGGMGAVYVAKHALLARPTAIKLLKPEASSEEMSQRFEREVRFTAQLTHPNTIAVYDFGRTGDGTFYYAMEYLEGTDLEALIADHGRQPPARVVHLMQQAVGSLADAHRNGMIHRDVKPANIMLTERGGVRDFIKVLDFGLVRTVEQKDTKLTGENQMLGTPLYMAPESMINPDNVDARVDLYAIGGVAYFLLTGEDAFSGNSHTEVISKHLAGTYRSLNDFDLELPKALVELVHACLSQERDDRPETADALLAQLLEVSRELPWTQSDASAWWEQHTGEEDALERRQREALSVAPTLTN